MGARALTAGPAAPIWTAILVVAGVERAHPVFALMAAVAFPTHATALVAPTFFADAFRCTDAESVAGARRTRPVSALTAGPTTSVISTFLSIAVRGTAFVVNTYLVLETALRATHRCCTDACALRAVQQDRALTTRTAAAVGTAFHPIAAMKHADPILAGFAASTCSAFPVAAIVAALLALALGYASRRYANSSLAFLPFVA